MLSKCCCCIPLRAGCIVLGIIGILVSLIEHIPVIYGFGAYLLIIPLLFDLVCYGTLFVGAIANHTTIVLVHLVMYILVMIIDVIFIILMAVNITTLMPALIDCKDFKEEFDEDGDCEDYRKGVANAAIIIVILVLVLNIYSGFCSLSFYLELKQNNGTPV